MANLFFTSDCHWGHANIIKYCNRPFDGLDDMHKVMVRNWNERVKPYDTVIHLGDWCFKNTAGGKTGEGVPVHGSQYAAAVNGHKVYVYGNHDHTNKNAPYKLSSMILKAGGEPVWVQHKPITRKEEVPDFCSVVLCGHVHEKWKTLRIDGILNINLGVDVWDFRPVSVGELVSVMVRERLGG